MRAALVVVLALLAGDELRRHYAVEKGPDATLPLGGRGMLSLRLTAKDDGYLHPDAPLRIKLRAGDRHVDIHGRLLDQRFVAGTAGEQQSDEYRGRSAHESEPPNEGPLLHTNRG